MIAVLLATAFAAAPASADPIGAQVSSEPAGVLGYLDFKTGAFVPKRPDPDAAKAVANVEFTVALTANVTVKSPGYKPTKIVCMLMLNNSPYEYDGPTYNDRMIATAPVSGGKATCQFRTSTRWDAIDAAVDTLDISLSVFDAADELVADRWREHMRDLGERAIPKSGGTVTVTTNVVL